MFTGVFHQVWCSSAVNFEGRLDDHRTLLAFRTDWPCSLSPPGIRGASWNTISRPAAISLTCPIKPSDWSTNALRGLLIVLFPISSGSASSPNAPPGPGRKFAGTTGIWRWQWKGELRGKVLPRDSQRQKFLMVWWIHKQILCKQHLKCIGGGDCEL